MQGSVDVMDELTAEQLGRDDRVTGQVAMV